VRLKGKGVKIYVVDDALRERGIEPGELIDGLDFVARSKLARLFGGLRPGVALVTSASENVGLSHPVG